MNALIQIKNVYVNFSKRSILSNISFNINSNQIITLIGPNGAGKSTLVRILLGLITPNQGIVKKISNLKIGYIPQKLNFETKFPISVIKFMQLLKNTKYHHAIHALKKSGVEHLKNMQLQKLSGGEIQRVLLARTLLHSPQLLILDEPNQGVDVSGQILFYKLIHKIKHELSCSVFMVSHDLNLVMARTDEVICLNNHICCSGTPKSITKSNEFISMFGENNLKEMALYQHKHNHIHIF
ncbi:zinc ABC transporter ATP-binding protein ZnuC [Buchnera aphidicola]|uniref:zinc ABC transporter ATP-binding protein ZnuC n=1 Tax=Buchnera aphidicola TaxID=9 RepID=UPI0034639FBE